MKRAKPRQASLFRDSGEIRKASGDLADLLTSEEGGHQHGISVRLYEGEVSVSMSYASGPEDEAGHYHPIVKEPDGDGYVLGVKTGAANAAKPVQVAAFNTSADIVRLRITEVDEDGLTTDFKSVTLTLNNNVSPEKVVGQLGARFMNAGNFEVDLETQLVFTDGVVVDKIRDNETVTLDFILKNEDGVIAVDIPSMALGGGDREYPVGESVLINTTGQAFQDSDLETSLGVSLIPVPLPS